MSRCRPAVAVLALGAFAACSEQQPIAPPASPEAPTFRVAGVGASQSGRYIVNFTSTSVPADFAARVSALGGAVDAAYDGVGVAVVSGLDEAAATALLASGGVSDVGPDEEFQFLDPDVPAEIEAVTDATPASASEPAKAFFFPRQWNMRQIGANVAWAAGKLGSPAVKVAILDTGIDYLHADLQGLVDLQNSASFVPSDDALTAARFPGRHVSTDLHVHGTHVAATVSSNGIAAAGVTSKTTLMAVKVLGVSGVGTTSGILAGIVFAVDRGADVINMSLGAQDLYNLKDKATKEYFRKVVDRAFQYAHRKGVTVVVAAGNEAQRLDVKHTYKPYCGAKHVICVSATGPTSAAGVNGPWANPDAFAAYSNFGLRRIDVAAPGGNSGILAVSAACSTSSLVLPICRTGTFVVRISGTSMASPHTAGLAALLVAEYGGNATGRIRSTIENSADDLGAPGEDAYYGRGRINVARALGLN